MAADPAGFFQELRRRKVVRATAAYVVVASGVVGVAEAAFPALQLPPWTLTFVVVLAILGLPVTVALSWAFDVRPSESEADDPEGVGASGREVGERAAVGRFRWTAGRIAVLGAVVILALAGAAMLFTGGGAAAVMENRVAVLPFENQTGDPELADLGVIAADWISDGLTAIDSVQVVSTTEVRQVLDDAGGAGSLPAVAGPGRAGLAVTGSYAVAGDSIQIRAQLVDPVEATSLASFGPVRSHRSDPMAALSAIRQQVMSEVTAAVSGNYGEWAANVSRPPKYEAYRRYLVGQERFNAGLYRESIQEFDRAMDVDATFYFPLHMIATAYGNMGQPARRDSVLRILEPHRSELPEVGRIWLDWQWASLEGDLYRAYQHARRAHDRAPGSTSRYIAALYALDTGRPRAAATLLREERENAEIRTRWLPFHTVLTEALHLMGDHQAELDAARQAQERFVDHPWPIVLEARALTGLGRPEEAEALVNEVRILASSPRSAASHVRRIGDVLAAHGHHDAAARVYALALDTWPAAEPGDAAGHELYADLLRRSGRLHEAAAQVARARELEPEDRNILALDGIIAAQQGDRPRAERIAARLAAREDPYAHGGNTYNRACIRARLGDRDRTVQLLRQAHAEGQRLGSWIRHDPDLQSLRGHPVYEALIRPKG